MATSALLKRAAAPFLNEISAVAAELVRHGWAEANAGNLSLRVPSTMPGSHALLVKRARARMRDIARRPLDCLCLVHVDDKSRLLGVVPGTARPSTELRAHLAVHRVLMEHRPADRAVLHTHPTATITLSMLVADGRKLVSLLARMHSEGPLAIAGRLTALRFAVPGSTELARTTAVAVARTPGVIWPMHGMIATGPNLSSVLDLIEVTDKAATIALGLGVRRMFSTGLTRAQEQAVRRAVGR